MFAYSHMNLNVQLQLPDISAFLRVDLCPRVTA